MLSSTNLKFDYRTLNSNHQNLHSSPNQRVSNSYKLDQSNFVTYIFSMLKTKIPPPLYMLIFAASMWLLDKYMPVSQWVSPGWQMFGWVVIVLGVLIDLFSMGLFMRAGTSPNPFRPENASQLVSTGLYRFTRNPMYLGMLVLLTGWAIHLGGLTPVAVLPLFIITLTTFQIKPEEQALEIIFGQEYTDYKNLVRRWI